ncbi:helix-turn-helix transcriptional regulator [Streptomyces sp. TLI_146]|uniref:XRE family transcriptional regulator n=1 Tax=Streptomyces sp. TLI_146 TaxID=1938858 RepID=UPI000C71376B|nr:helix-turn-helix transcriptional regulator [Streptomyces sp. TLI_146]PKV83310.1 helix-turn-helix protein [Streptomyces sp. TLI_146]
MGTGRRGRPERPLDTTVPALAELAHHLRGLRRTAGLTLDEMSRATNWSKGALSAATTGRDLPRPELVEAWVRTCAPGANRDLWHARYVRAAEAYHQARPGQPGTAVPSPATASPAPGAPSARPPSPRPTASMAPPPRDEQTWQREAQRTLVGDERPWGPRAHPAPIPLRYTTVGGDLTDPGPADPDLSGTYEDIGEVFALVGSGRLVILGDKGSGKTELARHLGARLLADAESVPDADPATDGFGPDVTDTGAALPVMVSLSDWTAEDEPYGIAGWLARRLTGTSPDDVRELLEQRRLLPVLDDFDKLSPQGRGHLLHALNQLPERASFVLVSGWAEFTETVERTDTVIARSSGILIRRLNVADLDGWIQRTSRAVPKAAAWSQVLEALRTDADAPARELLSDPFFAAAARLLYSEGRADPGELVRDGVSAVALEARLVDRLLGAAAPPPRRTGDERIKDAQVDKALRLAARATARSGDPVRDLRTLYVGPRQGRLSAAAYSAALFIVCFTFGQAFYGMTAAAGGYLYLRHDLERHRPGRRRLRIPPYMKLSALAGSLLAVLFSALLRMPGADATQWAGVAAVVVALGGCCLLLGTLEGAYTRACVGSLLRLRDLDPPCLKEALAVAQRRGLLQRTSQGIGFTHPAVARWYNGQSLRGTGPTLPRAATRKGGAATATDHSASDAKSSTK